MKAYTLIFGNDLRNRDKLESLEKYKYWDINDTKTVGDLKDFINCFNNKICSCMLKLYIDNQRFKGYEEDSIKLKEISQDGKIYIGQIEQKCKCNFLQVNQSLITLSKKRLIEKINDLEKKKELKDIKVQDFYDVVIDINSIKGINKGWRIEMSKKGEEKYLKYKDTDLIKIGVVGNVNKGKSFILSKLSKIELPTGTNINTKGLSVKYPELEDGNENRKFILLDSAGFEKPILKEKIKLENKEEEDALEEEKEKKEKGNDEYIDFKSRAKDILVTESFLQSFIISTSDLLLVVTDILSLSEQKLLNKIKREIKMRKETKKLFIIHNLKTFRTVEQVESYVNEILLKSSSFKLRKDSLITSDKTKTQIGYYFVELDQKDLTIFHLIYAADDSEAGKFYNQYAIDFIEGQFNNDWKKNRFDAIKEIKSKFVENSSKYLEQKIEENEFKSNEDILKERVIKLREEKELSLKKCVIDEMGLQTFKANGFEPQYNYFINKNDNILEIRVELPGNITPTIHPPKFIGENTVIIIDGEKKKDKEPKNIEDNIFNSRDFGKFNLEIVFKTEDNKIISKLKEKDRKNGILLLKYDLDLSDNLKEEEMTLEEKDEI